MIFKLETIIDVSLEGYKLLKHFSQNRTLPEKYNEEKLDDLLAIGTVRAYVVDGHLEQFEITLIGENLLELVEERIADAKEFVDFFNQSKEWKDENA